jgi:ABC-type oligopeptide transport system substrate-binding subunit
MHKIRLILFASLFLIFTSCEDPSEESNGRTVFSYNEMNGVTSLDPAAAADFQNISQVNQLFNGLLQMDEKLNVLPAIARSYTISEDGKMAKNTSLLYGLMFFFMTMPALKMEKADK